MNTHFTFLLAYNFILFIYSYLAKSLATLLVYFSPLYSLFLCSFLRMSNCTSFKDYLNTNTNDVYYQSLSSEYLTESEFNLKYNSLNSSNIKLSVIHVNIRSLNANYTKLIQLLFNINIHFDLIILSEIWSTNIEFLQNILPNYKMFYDIPNYSNVGGVGIFVDKKLTVALREDLKITSTSYKIENVFMEVTKKDSKFIIGGIYRHPNSKISQFKDDFDTLLHKLNCKGSKYIDCIIAGDFNIDLLKYDSNSDTKQFIDLIFSSNLLPISFLPTRITDKSATLIDHIYYGIKNKHSLATNSNVFTGNITNDLSDHLINYFIIPLSNKLPKQEDRPYIRIYSERNRKLFFDSISNIDWTKEIMFTSDPSLAYDLFYAKLEESFNNCFPLKQISRKRLKDKLWMTAGLKQAAAKKQKLYKAWLISKTAANKKCYTDYNKIYKTILRAAESSYYENIFDCHKNDSKSIWKQINTICSFSKKNKSSHFSITKLTINGSTITNPECIADEMNDYFCNVGSNIGSKIQPPAVTHSHYLHNSVNSSFYYDEIIPTEISNVIANLKKKKSSGFDFFNAALLVDVSDCISSPLAYIFNLSITRGIVPKNLKIAKVIPIFKKGDTDQPSNYRPISLLSVFNKIFEKIIAKRLLLFWNKQKVFNQHQFGFRSGHSTTLALINIIDDIYKMLDSGDHVLAIFFDLQKAFDTVDHTILLNKLYFYGIRGSIFDWFKSYLSDRSQYTKINNVSSGTKLINCGVPQGSVLGPLLFLIYINDIFNIPNLPAIPRLFADDTNIFISGKNYKELSDIGNSIITEINTWMASNKLSLNHDKTCFIVFNRSIQSSHELNLVLKDTKLTQVSSIKFLGVTLDENLNWKNHLNELHSNITKFCGIFFKIRNKMPSKILKNLYFATIYPKLLYGIELYANTCPTFLYDLMIINNKLLRILQNKPRDASIKDLYQTYNTLPIDKLFQYQLLLFSHKLIYFKSLLPSVFNNYFVLNSNVYSYNTRNRLAVHLQRYSTSFGSRCLDNKCAYLWNSLPDSIKKSHFQITLRV